MSEPPHSQPNRSDPASDRPSSGSPLLLAAILFLALAARLFWASRKGLVLDEFHTLFHGSQATWGAFVHHLGQDNHPPLAFLFVNATRSVFGDSDFALRIPAIVAGMIELILVLRIARAARVAKPLAAVAVLAASSLHMDCSAQVRMYALLALSVTACVDGILQLTRERTSRVAAIQVTLAIAAGLHTHYFFAQDLIWLGVAWIAGWIAAPEIRARLKRVIAPVLVGVALALPWYLTVFRTQWGHELPPGGDEVHVLDFFEAFIHQFVLNVSLAGPWRWVLLLAGAAISVLAGIGWFQLAKTKDAYQRFAAILIGSIAFGVPSGAWTLASYLPRAGFTWHYILPSAGALAVLAAEGARCGPKARILQVATVCAAALCVLNLTTRGTEDYPGAVAHVMEEWQPGDAVLVVEFQPPVFPIGSPWNRYALNLAPDGSEGTRYSSRVPLELATREPAPVPIEMNGIHVANPDDLIGPNRIWVIASAMPDSTLTMKRMRERFVKESRVETFGHRPIVHLFED